jgi:hypothetical protein
MLRRTKYLVYWLTAALLLALFASACGGDDDEELAAPTIGDAPALPMHTSQAAVERGDLALEEVVKRGEAMFTTSFNTLDGAGRPETTDTNDNNFRPRQEFPNNFNRISGPDANSCVACHSVPRPGGGGGNSSNVFVLADRFPFVNFDKGEGDGFEDHTLDMVGDERASLSVFGSGLIEMLAREMTLELQSIQHEASSEAKLAGAPVTRDLVTKGVSFGSITTRPDGTIDSSRVEGVDPDLIIKPFMQKGVIVSLREFVVKALNQHFGMQAVERFGDGEDPDADGVRDEITRGDVTALVMFLATFPPPARVMPPSPEARAAAERGEHLFATIGCTMCHIPSLRLDNPVFSEPNPFNPGGKLQISDVDNLVTVDLAAAGPTPRLNREPDGSLMVPAFTDLKRHEMGDVLNNEPLEHRGVPTDQWLTRKLWGFSNEPPFLHNGRATLISESIMAHGGEAQGQRDTFDALPDNDQAAIIEFLKTLQSVPEEGLVAADEGDGISAGWFFAGSGTGVAIALLGGLAFAFIRRRMADGSEL